MPQSPQNMTNASLFSRLGEIAEPRKPQVRGNE